MKSRMRLIGNILTILMCSFFFMYFLVDMVSWRPDLKFFVHLDWMPGINAGTWATLAMLLTWRVQDGKGGSW